MAYTNNTQMSQWIPPHLFADVGAGSPLAHAYASQIAYESRTPAGAGTFTVHIPILLPSNAAYRVGAYLATVDLIYKTATAALTSWATVDLNKMTLVAGTGGSGSFTGASIANTQDATHNTSALRSDLGVHCMTVTPTTPPWIDNDDSYVLSCTLIAAATSILDFYGARCNFTLRV